MNEILERLTLNISGPVRHDMLEGREHLVVPTVMVVEGVLNGSQGPLFYPAEELEPSVPAWNHKPLVVYHPKEGSACEPSILNTQKVGLILNTAWDSPKLRTESWIDIAAANRIDKRIIENLEAGKTLEVSTGVYTKNEKLTEEADFNGKKYKTIARNYRPDHLAILPDQIGACSIADGAGLLQLNSENLREGKLDKVTLATVMGKTGLRPMLVENEKSYQDVTSELYSQLYARFGYNAYIDAVFENYLIYCLDKEMYKVSYSKSDKEVVLGNDAVECYRKVSYITVNGEAFQTVSNVKADELEDVPMSKKVSIDALIANGGYEESDRKTLEGFPEAKLATMASKLVAPTKNEDTPPAPTNNADTVAVPKGMFDKMTAFIANAEKEKSDTKAKLVDEIVANEANVFAKEDLLKLEPNILQGIAKQLGVGQPAPVVNYFGAQGSAPMLNQKGAEESEEAYLPPTMNFEKSA